MGGLVGLTENDRMLHAGAFNWTYTLGTGFPDTWSAGATPLVPAEGTGPADLPTLLDRQYLTIFADLPGIYRQMLKQSNRLRLPQLRHGLSAGEKLPETTRAAWRTTTGTDLHEAFGMSECSTFISGCLHRPALPGTLGFPRRHRNVAILGADGSPAAREAPGSLAIRRDDPGLMLGYLDAPEETAARTCADWFLTGDTGAWTQGGAIHYLGRDDDMLNAGGY